MDCNRSNLLWVALTLPLSCGSGAANAPASEDARPHAAEPGVCFGKNTTCEAPEYVPLAPGPELRVDCVEGPDLVIAWQANLGTFDCRVAGCPAVNGVVAAGSGRQWAIAEVHTPGSEGTIGLQLEGFGLFEFEDTGVLAGSTATDMRSPLEAPIAPTRAIHVDADDSLRWLAPTVDRRGLELRHYGHGPQQLSANVLVGDALSGHARWNADGSLVLAYRFRERGEADAAELHAGNIARFDRNGGLLWNQTLRSQATEQGEPLRVHMIVGGLSANGEATIRAPSQLRRGAGTISTPTTRVLRLDADGNVAWAREIDNSFPPTSSLSEPDMRVLSDGSTLVVHMDATVAADGSVTPFVEKLDPAGQSSWRARLLGLPTASGTAAFDDRERVILADRLEHAISVAVFDTSQSSCSKHVLRVEPCEVIPGGGIGGCGEIAIAVAAPGRLFFGIRNQVGMASLP
jgi:hypothetical protein